jgi:hypothetical protein
MVLLPFLLLVRVDVRNVGVRDDSRARSCV